MKPIKTVARTLIGFCISLLLAVPLLHAESSASYKAANTTESEELIAFKAAIRAKYDMKEAAFRANDVEPIINRFYSDRVMSVDGDGNVHRGRAGIRPVYEEVIGSLVRIESVETVVNGDAGWDWVNFHVSFPPEAELKPFSFMMVFLWERIDGEWWSHGEMYVPGAFDMSN